MAVRNVPQRAGKMRGQIDMTTPLGRLMKRTMHTAPGKGKKQSARAATRAAQNEWRRARQRPRAPATGVFGRKTAALSRGTFNINRTNVKRKPEARRSRWAKKQLRKRALNPRLARRATQSAIKKAQRNRAGGAAGVTKPAKSKVRD